MTINNETFMAYVDDELEVAGVAAVEAALERDPSVARRVKAYRTQRLRLRAAYDRVLQEPVPPRLAAAAEGVPSLRSPHPTPARPSLARLWGLREVVAMAASVLVGAILTWSALSGRGPEPDLFVASGEGLVARSALARSLSEDLAGDAVAGPVRVGLSFRDQEGVYCRTFVVTDGRATAGLACRVPDGWQVQLAVRTGEGGEPLSYRQAASTLPAAVMGAVDERIEGEALGPAEERAARTRGWID